MSSEVSEMRQGFHFAGRSGFHFHGNNLVFMLEDIIDFAESPPGSLPIKKLRVHGWRLHRAKLLPDKLFGQSPLVLKKRIALIRAFDGGQPHAISASNFS